LRRKKFFLFTPVPQGYPQITKLFHKPALSLTQFKKVFSAAAKEIHTFCAKKKLRGFLAGIAKPQCGLLKDFYDNVCSGYSFKRSTSGLYHKNEKVNIFLKQAPVLQFNFPVHQ